jgi:hypothetical protein
MAVPATCDRQLGDGIGQVTIFDVPGAFLYSDAMRGTQHVGDGTALRRHELKTRQFQQLAVWVAKIDRVHEPAINRARVLDSAFVQAPRYDIECSLRNGKRQMVYIADAPGLGDDPPTIRPTKT